MRSGSQDAPSDLCHAARVLGSLERSIQLVHGYEYDAYKVSGVVGLYSAGRCASQPPPAQTVEGGHDVTRESAPAELQLVLGFY